MTHQSVARNRCGIPALASSHLMRNRPLVALGERPASHRKTIGTEPCDDLVEPTAV
jgi:hypothetical protein